MKVQMEERLKRRIEHRAFLKITEKVGSHDLIDVTKEEIATTIDEVLDEISERKIFPTIPSEEEFIEMIQQVNSSIYQENVARIKPEPLNYGNAEIIEIDINKMKKVIK